MSEGVVRSLRGAFVPGATPPNEEVIDVLERLLADAKSGFIRGVVYGTVDKDRGLTRGWVGDADQHLMAAASARLAHCVMLAWDQNEDD